VLKTVFDRYWSLLAEEGTTWYEHGLWPASYWQLWSSHIVHATHRRGLRQVKALSETGSI